MLIKILFLLACNVGLYGAAAAGAGAGAKVLKPSAKQQLLSGQKSEMAKRMFDYYHIYDVNRIVSRGQLERKALSEAYLTAQQDELKRHRGYERLIIHVDGYDVYLEVVRKTITWVSSASGKTLEKEVDDSLVLRGKKRNPITKKFEEKYTLSFDINGLCTNTQTWTPLDERIFNETYKHLCQRYDENTFKEPESSECRMQ